MKWPKTKRTEYQGLLYIEQLVNETGNIFRKIHLEEDVGLDGVIEFVKDGEATGRLLALQVKSGDSYVVAGKDRFTVPVDVAHQIYWQSYDLPVVLVCYSPSQKLAAWEDIKQYIQYQLDFVHFHRKNRQPKRSVQAESRGLQLHQDEWGMWEKSQSPRDAARQERAPPEKWRRACETRPLERQEPAHQGVTLAQRGSRDCRGQRAEESRARWLDLPIGAASQCPDGRALPQRSLPDSSASCASLTICSAV